MVDFGELFLNFFCLFGEKGLKLGRSVKSFMCVLVFGWWFFGSKV